MKYVFRSLTSIADWLTNKGMERRDSATGNITKTRARELIAEASAYENIADMLRNTTLDQTSETDMQVHVNPSVREEKQ